MASNRVVEIAVAWIIGVCCGLVAYPLPQGVGMFAPNVDLTPIVIGPEEHPVCQISTYVEVWPDMNRVGAWQFPAACVKALEIKETDP